MHGPLIGKKPNRESVKVRNAEVSAQIPLGTPVFLALNGTEDGFAVIRPSTASANSVGDFFSGILERALDAGEVGSSVVYGFCLKALFSQQTRAASTDNFASAPAVAIGDLLTVDTLVNCVTVEAAQPAGEQPYFMKAAQTIASADSIASTSSDTRLAVTQYLKVFIRSL